MLKMNHHHLLIIFIEKVVEQMKEQDIEDRKVYKEKLKRKEKAKKNY